MRKFDKITSFKEKTQRAKPLKKALSATKDSNLNGTVIHNFLFMLAHHGGY